MVRQRTFETTIPIFGRPTRVTIRARCFVGMDGGPEPQIDEVIGPFREDLTLTVNDFDPDALRAARKSVIAEWTEYP